MTDSSKSLSYQPVITLRQLRMRGTSHFIAKTDCRNPFLVDGEGKILAGRSVRHPG